ncbi:MAG TPA: glycogen-binding domain-containing protein [Pyrinomonadaceae bacterium]|jgi:1,4-alpha-glucan branching enzyme
MRKALALDPKLAQGSDAETFIARKTLLPSTTGNTTFRLVGHADAKTVALAGTFNNWNPSQTFFTKSGDEWICKINLAPGKYQYKFVVDGNWILDPGNAATEDDGSGNKNSLLIVEAK